MLHALIRDDGGKSLILDGALSVSELHDGRISDHVLVDNKFVTDGLIVRPRLSTLQAVISPNPIADNLSYGDERIREVFSWLRDVRDMALSLSIQVPGRPTIENMAIESFSLDSGTSDSINCSISFKELRIAYSRSTVLTQIQKKNNKKGKPSSEVESGTADEKDKGTSFLKSILNSVLDKDSQKKVLNSFVKYTGLTDKKTWEPGG